MGVKLHRIAKNCDHMLMASGQRKLADSGNAGRSAALRRRLALEANTMSDARRKLLDAFKARAFSLGDFTLASGKKSSYYVNSKKALFNGDVVNLLSEVLWEMTKDLNVDAAGGLEVGAIPMA